MTPPEADRQAAAATVEPSQFAIDTAVQRDAHRPIYAADIPESWSVGRGPNGGFTAAILLRAALAEVGLHVSMHPRSFTTHLLGAPKTGPCTITVTLDRVGRTAAFVEARLHQGDMLSAVGRLVAVVDLADPVRFNQRQMPDVPRPESLAGVPDVRREVPTYISNYEQRFATPAIDTYDDPVVLAWTRLVDPHPFDPCAVVAIADSFPPPSMVASDVLVGALTLDYTVHFRSKLPHPSTTSEGFVLAELISEVSQDGLADEDGWIWAPDGTLLAQARQLGLLQVATPDQLPGS